MEKYDLIIVGAGPAGLTAGIYSARYNLKFVIFGTLFGGEISEAHKVCNFPTYKEITGFELSQKMIEQVKDLGGEIKQEEVVGFKKEDGGFLVKTNKGDYFGKKIVFAVGRKKQKLGVPGEDEFLGRGVSYCATCDGAFYKNKIVAVVGGGNAALTAALLLAEHASKVYIIYRRDKFFRAEPAWVKQVEANEKIESVFNSEISEIYGSNSVEGVKLKDGKSIKLDGVFVEVGFTPHEELIKELGLKSEKGYVIVDKEMRTNIEGVFAAGDVTNNPLKQAITASAEGAIAATTAYEELTKER